MNPLVINENEKILIIAPHPDDECIGVGGLLSQYASQCDVWLLTNGCRGSSRYGISELNDIRKAEFLREMRMLNPNEFRIFDFEDATLSNHEECLDEEDLSVYNKIFVTNKCDRHADHRSAFRIVKHALSRQQLQVDLYQYEIGQPLQQATHYLDISQTVEQKRQLICCHESQLHEFDYCKLAMSLNAYRSVFLQLRGGYAEAYCKEDIDYMDMQQMLFLDKRIQRQNLAIEIYEKWIISGFNCFSIEKKLLDMGVSTLAIYGYGKLGRLFKRYLAGHGEVRLLYIIDERAESLQSEGVPLVSPKKMLERVDLLVITVLEECETIRCSMHQKGFYNIIDLKQLLEDK